MCYISPGAGVSPLLNCWLSIIQNKIWNKNFIIPGGKIDTLMDDVVVYIYFFIFQNTICDVLYYPLTILWMLLMYILYVLIYV